MNPVMDTLPFPALLPCPGPLVWFRVGRYDGGCECGWGAVLECSRCRAVLTTGNFMDGAHLFTPIMVSPR